MTYWMSYNYNNQKYRKSLLDVSFIGFAIGFCKVHVLKKNQKELGIANFYVSGVGCYNLNIMNP